MAAGDLGQFSDTNTENMNIRDLAAGGSAVVLVLYTTTIEASRCSSTAN